jgi:hypothetical protein
LSGIIQRLRRSLVRSRFSVLTHRAHGYELIVREQEAAEEFEAGGKDGSRSREVGR